MAKQEVTKKPSGLSLSRANSKFTLGWKIADANYGDGQQFQYALDRVGKKDKFVSASVGAKTTSKAITINKANYYPYKKKPKLNKVIMRVRGNRKKYTTGSGSKKKTHNPAYSDWSQKEFVLSVPRTPSLSVSLDDELSNVCKFTWGVVVNSNDGPMFTNVEWQSMLVKNCTKAPNKLSWKKKTAAKIGNTYLWSSGTGSSNSSKTFTEDTATLSKGTYTRVFRVRARGPKGASSWRYGKHVYAIPNRAVIKSYNVVTTKSSNYKVTVTWEAGISSGARPIDNTVVQYAIGVPSANLGVPGDANWTDANISRDTGGTDSAVFFTDRLVGTDECLFVRVNTQHDSNVMYGIPTRVKTGKLANPSDLSIQAEQETHKISITNVQNNSDVQDSFTVVSFHPKKGSVVYIAMMNHDQTQKTGIQCPDWGSDSPTIGVMAYSGTFKKTTLDGNVDSYLLDFVANKYMKSTDIRTGGAVPVKPDNVAVSQTSVVGSVRVDWDWTWAKADSAEISWSDHIDAWESTDEPETYIVSHLKTSRWNIAGLTTGITWYVRVRLLYSSGDEPTYGPYSDIVEIDLSSAPSKPVLDLSTNVMPEDGSVVASWVYSTTDGTPQAYAEICEATVHATGVEYGSYRLSDDKSTLQTLPDGSSALNGKQYYIRSGGQGTYEDPYTYTVVDNVSVEDDPQANGWYEFYQSIAHTETSQHVTIEAKEVGWKSGETYNLALRTVSASGRVSDEWSDVVPITIAEPLVCSIESTSLETQITETNPVVQEGQSVEWNTEIEGVVVSAVVNMEPSLQGYTSIDLLHSDGQPESENNMSYMEDWSSIGPIFGGSVDFISGLLTVTDGYISGYNGEILSSTWISDMDEYVEGTTPTIGANVVYKLETPETYTITKNIISMYVGDNQLSNSINGAMTIRRADDYSEVLALTEMPLSVTAIGAGEGGTTTIAVERAEDYLMNRPDEDTFNGFEGETILLESQVGEAEMVFNTDGLLGSLDDGAAYRIVATVVDDLGQSSEALLRFVVRWNHQAVIPSAEVQIDQENLIAKITPIAPEGAISSDVCDIYRLSVDKPELIFSGAQFGHTYVDPYPALGEMGGHRVVLRTANGDYITQDNEIAWFDTHEDEGDIVNVEYNINIIDFGGQQIQFYYDTDYNSQWAKDFVQTEYLGGSVQGDWNPAVNRTGTMNSYAITVLDQEMIQALRRLAVYPGACHVRTADGSSYAADVQLSEDRTHDDMEMRASYSINITRVDSDGFDGMTLESWEELNPEEQGGE